MIIDTHIHLYDPMRPQGVPWPDPDNRLLYRTTLPVHAKAQSVGEGVTGTVLVEATDWMEDNQWILDLAADEPFIVGLVGRMDPCRPDFSDNLKRFAPHPLFQGIRFRDRPHYDHIDEGSFMRDMERLAGRDLVLDTGLVGAHEEGFFAMLDRLPDLRVMIEHIAGGTVDGGPPDSAWAERMQRAGSYPNVWMKVSALMEHSTIQPAPANVDFYAPLLDTLWDAYGEDRLVYGSNWPVSERAGTYTRGIQIVKAYLAGKSEGAREKFFWRNSKDLYRWEER